MSKVSKVFKTAGKVFTGSGPKRPPPLPTLAPLPPLSALSSNLPDTPKPEVTPLPPLPQRTDPTIEAARKRQLVAGKLRKGRRSTILTPGRGLGEVPSISRPAARSAQLLGA